MTWLIHRMSRIALLLITVAALQPARAQPLDWTLITADFDRQVVAVNQIDGTNLITSQHGKQITIGLDQVLRLDRQNLSAGNDGLWQLLLFNGDRIFGHCGDLRNDSLTWTNSVLVGLRFPLDQVRAMARTRDLPGLDETRTEDRILMTNHDQVNGVVAGIKDGNLSVQANSQTNTIPLTSTDAILFASPPPARNAASEGYRLTLHDQSRVTVHGLSLKAGELVATLSASDQKHRLNFDYVISIEHLNGPVSWLSDRTPVVSEQAAFASDLSYPAQMDRNVFGRPLRFEGETFAKGIGVHANSKLVFALDGSYKTFRTRYAIDTSGDCSKADVNVRVLLDKKLVHVKQHLKAYEMSPLVNIDLAGAKTLALEVTAGGATDTQDRLDWLESALVRQGTVEHPLSGLSPTTGTVGP